jgi:hypothetical protein
VVERFAQIVLGQKRPQQLHVLVGSPRQRAGDEVERVGREGNGFHRESPGSGVAAQGVTVTGAGYRTGRV